MKSAIFHREAEAELQGAIAWYEGVREGLGHDFQDLVEMSIGLICADATRHPKHNDQGLRKLRLARFPYTIYFLELEDVIWIAAVAHNKRKPDYWISREPND